jgi:hypothetical protein
MDPKLSKDAIKAVETMQDKDGRLRMTVVIDRTKIDKAALERLSSLSGLPTSEVLQRLGAEGIGVIQAKLHEDSAFAKDED